MILGNECTSTVNLQKFIMVLGQGAIFFNVAFFSYWINPCFSPFLGAILFMDQDGHCLIKEWDNVHRITASLLLFLVDEWLFTNLISGATFVSSHVMCLGASCLLETLLKLKRYEAINMHLNIDKFKCITFISDTYM